MGAPLKVSLMEGIGAQLKLMLIWNTLWEKAIGVTADHLVFLKVLQIIINITINFYVNLFRCHLTVLIIHYSFERKDLS